MLRLIAGHHHQPTVGIAISSGSRMLARVDCAKWPPRPEIAVLGRFLHRYENRTFSSLAGLADTPLLVIFLHRTEGLTFAEMVSHENDMKMTRRGCTGSCTSDILRIRLAPANCGGANTLKNGGSAAAATCSGTLGGATIPDRRSKAGQ